MKGRNQNINYLFIEFFSIFKFGTFSYTCIKFHNKVIAWISAGM